MIKRTFSSADSREIGIYIYFPDYDDKEDEFNCKYGTFGFNNDISLSAIGIDSFQSIFNALMQLDYFVRNSSEYLELDLKWAGALNAGDTGIRIPVV